MLGIVKEKNMKDRVNPKELTVDECMEVFRKYDKSLYDFYQHNAWYFGCDARRYAEYLLKKKGDNPNA